MRNTLNLLKSVITSILNAIKTVFTNIFDGIRDSVSGIIEGTCGFIKDSINSILNCAESMANGIVRGINTMIGALNSIHVDIPEWVPLVGGEVFRNIPCARAGGQHSQACGRRVREGKHAAAGHDRRQPASG